MKTFPSKLGWLFLGFSLAACFPARAADSGSKKIVLVAGTPSHGPGDHEFNAGVLLLKKCLDRLPGVTATAHLNGWPKDPQAFDGAATILFFMDGGGGHPIIKDDHLQIIGNLMKKGVGLACVHYAVEVPKDKGGPEFLDWIGGYYETGFSTNPHWDAEIKTLPQHPVTRGVRPFTVRDEWYYNIRFRNDTNQLTPLLVATPSDETRKGQSSSPRGPYSHIQSASGRPEILAWALERPDGGRGFGFTGAHFHKNWGNDNFRKLVLNALFWTAKIEVPAEGVASSVTQADLEANLDPKGERKPPRASAESTPPKNPPAPAPALGLAAAKEYTQTFTVAPGLEARLFAAEPQLVNPADMDIDARGRVWITEGVNYRRWNNLRPEGDRIVILEDTNFDGVADKTTTFYQGTDINTALGICVLGNKVIVSCSPNVFLFTDTDGDDKADKKEILFTGISGAQHDHGVHAFVFGPDGKLYFNMGNSGERLKKADGSPVIDLDGKEVAATGKPYRQGMVFRCNLDGSALETLGHNFRNNYEVAVDSFGTLWQSDNDDDGNRGVRINFVMEHGNFGYVDEVTGAGWSQKRTNLEEDVPRRHWHQNDPGVVPNLLITGAGSPTGILVYEGNLLPAQYRNQLVHCDAGPSIVRAYLLRKQGAGYHAEIGNLVEGKDKWFRPADVCAAPDGSLYIADWNDPGVGGHNMGDNQPGEMRGRVYRLAPPGSKPRPVKLDLATAKDAVAALRSPNQATRYLAWTRLHEMQRSAEKELGKLWRSDNPRMRARALQLLARIDGRTKAYLDKAVKDRDPDIRITALRIARAEKENLLPYVGMLARDPAPEVRRECALALRHQSSAEAADLWATLAEQHDGKDRWYLEALGIGADGQENKFFAAWLKRAGSNWNTAAGRDIIWRSRAKEVPRYLVQIINDKNLPASDRPRYLRALDFLSGPERDAALVELSTSSLSP